MLIEPTAGGGGALASDAASLAAFLDALGRDERVGVCLDTCHLHAAGHDLSTRAGFTTALRRYGRAAGRGGFSALFTSAATRGVALIVESADTDHAADIATLKALRCGG